MNTVATTLTADSSALEAAFERSGISLPVPFMELSATVIRDLPLAHVADLKRFEAAAKSELAALSNMDLTWKLIDASAAFSEACRTMGLADWLGNTHFKPLDAGQKS